MTTRRGAKTGRPATTPEGDPVGITIQPLTAEELSHRATLARLFQHSTLAQLKTAAELYREDDDLDLKAADPASAAQCLVELGRRGEWSENALNGPGVRWRVESAADFDDAHIATLLGALPRAGYTTKHVAFQVHLLRAERFLREHEARLEALASA